MLTKPAESAEQVALVAEVATCQEYGTKKNGIKANGDWTECRRPDPRSIACQFKHTRQHQENCEYEASEQNARFLCRHLKTLGLT